MRRRYLHAYSLLFGFLLGVSGCGGDDGGGVEPGAEDAGSTPMMDASVEDAIARPDGMPPGPSREVIVENVPCNSPDFELPRGWGPVLASAGFTKCVAPFGVIIAGPESVPDSYINLVARIVAELLDPDMNGYANDPGVRSQLAMGRNVWLPMPVDEERWTGGLEESLGRDLGAYGIMIPEWWLGEFQATPDERAVQVMVEEVFHAFTQFGYALEYPEVFGVDTWDSLIARETQRAQCDWWQHPENDCPGSPSMGGDCSDPSCDVTEFYHQVVILRAGMTPGWFGIGFPRDRETLDLVLSDEVEEAIENPTYHQLTEPLTFTYGQ